MSKRYEDIVVDGWIVEGYRKLVKDTTLHVWYDETVGWQWEDGRAGYGSSPTCKDAMRDVARSAREAVEE